jgi:hypothetical protein
MRLDFFMTIVVDASIFFVVAVPFPRLFLRRRSTVVAVASPLAIASTVAVSAFWLVVESAASVASRSVVGGAASIVAASAVRSTSVVSSALTLARLAPSVARAARLAFLTNVVYECPLGTLTQPLDLVSFERAVDFTLELDPQG